MMVLLNAFMIYTLKNRRHHKKWIQRFGPLMLTLLAAPLILADPLRHVLNDENLVNLSMYRDDTDEENITALSVWGWLFTIIFTYSGFVCLFFGVLWNASIIQKLKVIRMRWRELREASRLQTTAVQAQ